MNYIISIIKPEALKPLTELYRQCQLPISLELFGRGTAPANVMDLLGIESHDRRIVMTVVGQEKTPRLLAQQRQRLFLDVPGNGVVLAIPVKSVGGKTTMAFLGENQPAHYTPQSDYPHELILAISNEGFVDVVMDAAREAGAKGGTVLHGKGTASGSHAKFFQVSLVQEKEVILIVAAREEKTAIMQSILTKAGPGTDAGAILFSLPVSEVAGFGIRKAEEGSEKE